MDQRRMAPGIVLMTEINPLRISSSLSGGLQFNSRFLVPLKHGKLLSAISQVQNVRV